MHLKWVELRNKRTGTIRRAPVLLCSIADMRELDDACAGLCLACGEIEWGGCEPDMRGGECSSCGAGKVYGAEEAAIMGRVEITEGDDERDEHDEHAD